MKPAADHINPELLVAIAHGDRAAFTLFFDHYHPKVLHVAWLYTHSQSQSDDVVQDVFLRIWLKREQLPLLKSIDNWIFVIARNVSLKALSAGARAALTGEEPPDYLPALERSAESHLEAGQLDELIREALQKVTVQQRRVFELIRLLGLSRAATATALGLQPDTVKMHLLRATRVVRAHLVSQLDYLTLIALVGHFL